MTYPKNYPRVFTEAVPHKKLEMDMYARTARLVDTSNKQDRSLKASQARLADKSFTAFVREHNKKVSN